MSEFIGADLNQEQIACLVAVAQNGSGVFGKASKMRSTIESYVDCRLLWEATDEQIEVLLRQLEKEYLIERKFIKGEQHIGLTADGRRCNYVPHYLVD